MAATQYQVLYRYLNEATNNAITNSANEEYVETLEFYQKDHKLLFRSDKEKSEAEDEKQKMISEGNSPDNIKTDMLFAYAGTKKIKHQIYKPEETGYVVRDYTLLDRRKIGNRGDFSKEFTTLNSPTPEDGGTVVCIKDIMAKYFNNSTSTAAKTITVDPTTGDLSNSYGSYFSTDEISKVIRESNIFQLNLDPLELLNKYTTTVSTTYPTGYPYGAEYGSYIPASKAFSIDNPAPGFTFSEYTTGRTGPVVNVIEKGYTNSATVYNSFTINPMEHIKTVTIPSRNEDVVSYPYLIKDTYVRIKMQPWFVNYTTGSLERAIAKAKTIVEMIGIENVKVLKIVPFDQFIKIN